MKYLFLILLLTGCASTYSKSEIKLHVSVCALEQREKFGDLLAEESGDNGYEMMLATIQAIQWCVEEME